MSRHLGLDLGGTNIKRVILESAGGSITVRDRASSSTDAAAGPEGVASRLVEAGRMAVAAHGLPQTVGLGVPGLFEPDTGRIVLFPNLPGPWRGFPLRDRVSEGLGMDVAMINDARAFTLAEATIGAGRGCQTVVAVVLGTGVGGGIMIDGRLHLGAFGTAGEIAHQTILPDGPLCGCGNRGCAEALTKAEALAAYAGRSSPEEVYAAAAEGDAKALEAINTVAKYLGIALANTVTLIGPERVIVGGGIAEAGDLVLGPIREAVRERVTLVPVEQIEVVAAELGPWAGAVGAALAGMDQVRAR